MSHQLLPMLLTSADMEGAAVRSRVKTTGVQLSHGLGLELYLLIEVSPTL